MHLMDQKQTKIVHNTCRFVAVAFSQDPAATLKPNLSSCDFHFNLKTFELPLLSSKSPSLDDFASIVLSSAVLFDFQPQRQKCAFWYQSNLHCCYSTFLFVVKALKVLCSGSLLHQCSGCGTGIVVLLQSTLLSTTEQKPSKIQSNAC